ncbi:hypothetical protein L6452_14940 [Arctium lappa]|uniref:Uncharacterized protein n=1 Tax=Arctium lappa TaxID=4217 RepID=A0ACB9CM86_ARCLA|nr:hypothetical protein L6452_14940 [Arctium lappa]
MSRTNITPASFFANLRLNPDIIQEWEPSISGQSSVLKGHVMVRGASQSIQTKGRTNSRIVEKMKSQAEMKMLEEKKYSLCVFLQKFSLGSIRAAIPDHYLTSAACTMATNQYSTAITC